MSQLGNKLYIAAIGMLTPLGYNSAMTSAAVGAGISAYKLSDYRSKSGRAIRTSPVPEEIFSLDVDVEKNATYRPQYDRVIKMAALALQDVEKELSKPIKKAIPLILALPESIPNVDQTPPHLLLNNILKLSDIPIDGSKVQGVPTGRAAGLQALELAERNLFQLGDDFVLIGGSDSYINLSFINHLEEQDRLLFEGKIGGFVIGEGASFLLLTRHAEHAMQQDNHIIAINPVGIADEHGHIGSDEPYRGDGLDQAFKQALANYSGHKIDAIYGSMNGEAFWSKEQGVAQTRNHQFFTDNLAIEHPADCFGDLGAAMGSTLIGVSALALLDDKRHNAHLVYSSSDGAKRAAVIVEKISIT
ncbi:hypothetical protein [Teredinibacter haidensis]|uniref:hypothetical protein n=1 Tax=Teredinibacter haidensis TaxID=2731755 RepID=UPI000948D306|nr:hypothetical protein [Teredinibacter haidensis]